jgi:ABC-2 type transport system permease protein
MDALKAVIRLSMTRMVRSRRTFMMIILSLAPVAGALIAVAVATIFKKGGGYTGFGLITEMFGFAYLQFMLLGISLFYGTSLIGDEVDDKTITYLFMRPIPRSTLFLGKYLSGVIMGLCIVIPSAILTFTILSTLDPMSEVISHLGIFAKDLGILALGIMTYIAFFGFLGALFKRPVLIGIVFSLVWESMITYVPGYISKFTVLHYLQSLLPHPSAQRGLQELFQQMTSPPIAVLMLFIIAGAFTALGCWTVTKKEYVLPG